MSARPDLSSVSIVVLCYNRIDIIEANLRYHLDIVRECGCELILVDNASTDGTAEVIQRLTTGVEGVRAIMNDDNLGVALGRNIGWEIASRDYILSVDDDTIISEEAISAMLSEMKEKVNVGVLSPRILHFQTKQKQFDFGAVAIPVAGFHEACHMLQRHVFRQLGGYDPKSMFGGEGLEYSIRVRTAGYDVIYSPCATVLHKNFPRTGKEGKGRREQWIYNFIRIFYLNFPAGTASLFAARYFLSHFVSGFMAFGPLFALSLFAPVYRGMRDGRAEHKRVPDHVTRFYRNPDLRPDLGNVPIYRKLLRKIIG